MSLVAPKGAAFFVGSPIAGIGAYAPSKNGDMTRNTGRLR